MVFSLVRRHCIATAVLLASVGVCAAATSPQQTILVVGDSLSAEYGLKRGSGWVALLGKRLQDSGKLVTVVNASISGDTTAGGASRLPALLAQHKPTHVIIELGGNDALRGLPVTTTQTNLNRMTQMALQAKARVLLLGMAVPPNYGADYAEQFSQTFVKVARSNRVALVPFFLKGVADVPQADTLFQSDHIHPTEQAHPIMLDNVWRELQKLL